MRSASDPERKEEDADLSENTLVFDEKERRFDWRRVTLSLESRIGFEEEEKESTSLDSLAGSESQSSTSF